MKRLCTIMGVVATMLITPIAAQGARSVDWPSGYEAALASHIAETSPSGGHVGTGAAYVGFDSVLEIVAVAFFAELRNAPVPGLIIIIQ